MADESGSESIPEATVVRRRGARLSVVWVIPILAAAIALGIAAQRILSEGPTITIVFKAAEGLEAEFLCGPGMAVKGLRTARPRFSDRK